MLAAVFCVLVLAILVKLNRGKYENLSPYLVAATLMGVCLFFFFKTPDVQLGAQTESLTWAPSFGANLDFRLDGLSQVFVILISGIGCGVFLYAAAYMKDYKNLSGFYATLVIFTAAMIGLVLSDNLIAFFLFWEMTSLCSFLLVGFKNHTEEARESARKALFVTIGGGLSLLIAIALISLFGQSNGLSLSDSLKFSKIDSSIAEHSYYFAIVVCTALAVATKSAQFPLHIWLPAAMSGPTPVSSFLHSATMVKAGIFLLARLNPSLGGTTLWAAVFIILGSITMVIGAVLAASQRDIKKILAYSTISVLGILVMLLGLGTDMSIKAAVVFLVAHAFYKAALFQIIGNIDYATGSRDIKTLSNLARFMPFTAAAALLSVLSMAGSPPLFGFFGKELAYLAKLQLGGSGAVLILASVITNALLVGLAISIFYRPFWAKALSNGSVEKRKLPLSMALVPLSLSILGLLIGLFPALFDQHLGTQMASAIAGRTLEMKLKLWHGANLESLLVLGLSILTLSLGFIAAVKIKPLIAYFSKKQEYLSEIGPDSLFSKSMCLILAMGKLITNFFQNGDLTHYLKIILAAVLVLLGWPLLGVLSESLPEFTGGMLHLGLAVFIGLPIVVCFCMRTSDHIKQIIMLGISGFGLVMTFVILGAPDLALTQLMVEALSIIFFLLLIAGITTKSFTDRLEASAVTIALAFAVTITALIAVPVSELPNVVSRYYLDSSHLQAFGMNVVNVILVDFRALDTFGEVVVVGIAALGVGALLLSKRGEKTNG